MSGFKFHFQSDPDENYSAGSADQACMDEFLLGLEVLVTEENKSRSSSYSLCKFSVERAESKVTLNCVDEKQAERLAAAEEKGLVREAVAVDSDVVKGLYEGGMKIWECTSDLLSYVIDEKLRFDDKLVLDLGCGAGLLGIYSSLNGARAVHYQDYNAEVLNLVTIPNVLINNALQTPETSRFFAGDWGSMNSLLQCYDVILSSETIYDPQNYSKLAQVMDEFLTPDGYILLAAKTHYFGVGGSLRQFEDLLASSGKWRTKVCFTTSIGVRREVILISRKH